ncbi:hypothetical protein FEM48_Zijuj04G0088400 [Ziziphus jujuba var. spinosa]|uniref:FBD domain-containing protein n=1 Tax=Ziziphus jujuba var. spinosa TaxID=714518 RepID=A0A978VIX7_ZIZJJ|nr:hypothetical protein FEM48_Zijuj04G0088400 [Ziziphus jujuba var. spinosa]
MFLDINLEKPHSLVIDAPKLLFLIWNGMATGYECVGGYLEAKPCVEISIFGTLNTWGEVFRSLRAVSELSLSNFPMELMSSKYCWEIFHNLNSLTVWIGDLAPYLNRLEVKIRAASPTKHTAEYWESQVFAFVNSLESVRLDINGEQNGIELIKYLLRNARELKTIIIHCSFDPKVISSSLEHFRWASPSARVYFN